MRLVTDIMVGWRMYRATRGYPCSAFPLHDAGRSCLLDDERPLLETVINPIHEKWQHIPKMCAVCNWYITCRSCSQRHKARHRRNCGRHWKREVITIYSPSGKRQTWYIDQESPVQGNVSYCGDIGNRRHTGEGGTDCFSVVPPPFFSFVNTHDENMTYFSIVLSTRPHIAVEMAGATAN